MEISAEIKAKAQAWLDGNYDNETKDQIRNLLANDPNEIVECFYQDLEFGTGGLRGIMGVGTNRMNIYTVGIATQGLCNYLKKNFANLPLIKVAVAHDCRNNSRLFAETAAQIFSANGIKTYLFEDLRPTPELSFAIRELGCQSGINITASHNPKEYNGYKAYWEDGGQIIAPHDTNIVDEAAKIKSIDEVKFNGDSSLIEIIGAEIDKIYINKLKGLSLSPDAIKRQKDIKIVFTPIHGTGITLVPDTLKAFGFENIIGVSVQNVVSGNFPTVISPNPENAEALKLAIEKAEETGADLVLATDPDADRVGVAVRNDKGEFVLLNGNQTGAVLVYYLIRRWKETGKLKGKEYVVKTIVTTELIKAIADKFNVESFDVLTGFKYIADIIKQKEGKMNFIGGGEESYGYLAGEFVRDKDAVMACALIAEAAAWAKDCGKSFFDMLLDIYVEFGYYREDLVNVTKKGKAGQEEIQQMMAAYRANPPKSINGSKVVVIKDYEEQLETIVETGETKVIDQPKSNVLQFVTEDETKISVRPSGTEPKIKFYFGVKGSLASKDEYYAVEEKQVEKIKSIVADLKL